MDQLGRCLSLVMEAVDVRFIAGQALPQDLDGDLPAERKLLGQIDLGHAAPAQAAEKLVIPQPPTRQIGLVLHISGGRGGGHTGREASAVSSLLADTARYNCTRLSRGAFRTLSLPIIIL